MRKGTSCSCTVGILKRNYISCFYLYISCMYFRFPPVPKAKFIISSIDMSFTFCSIKRESIIAIIILVSNYSCSTSNLKINLIRIVMFFQSTFIIMCSKSQIIIKAITITRRC